MKKFKLNTEYKAKSICDYDCIFNFRIIKRTEKTVTIATRDGEKRCKIYVFENVETIYPLGNYSMCPILRAA